MKWLFYIVIISFLSCNNSKNNDVSKENVIADTLVQKTEKIIKPDTLTKVSELFKINDIECYWKGSIVMEQGDYEGGNITRELINNKTQKGILKDTDFYHINGYNNIDFEKEKENFKDVNFDGFKDYIVHNYSNSPQALNPFYNIHIFNNSTKSFDFSEELSGTDIEIDSINRKLISNYLYMGHSAKTIHHFDKKGKTKFTEIFRENSAIINDTVYTGKEYMKIINGKVVETKEDW